MPLSGQFVYIQLGSITSELSWWAEILTGPAWLAFSRLFDKGMALGFQAVDARESLPSFPSI